MAIIQMVGNSRIFLSNWVLLSILHILNITRLEILDNIGNVGQMEKKLKNNVLFFSVLFLYFVVFCTIWQPKLPAYPNEMSKNVQKKKKWYNTTNHQKLLYMNEQKTEFQHKNDQNLVESFGTVN